MMLLRIELMMILMMYQTITAISKENGGVLGTKADVLAVMAKAAPAELELV